MRIRKKVKKWGNSGGVSVPGEFIGKKITLILPRIPKGGKNEK